MGAAKKLPEHRNIEALLRLLSDNRTLSASNQDVPLATDQMRASRVTKVLFVESDVFTAHALCEYLNEDACGIFNVVQVPGLVEALTELDRSAFDIILLDLSQPETRGLAGFMRMHASYRNIPVVVLTTARDSFIGARAIMAGARGHVIKGETDRAALLRSIRRALEGSETVRIDLPQASNDLPLLNLTHHRRPQRARRSSHLQLVSP